MDQQVFKSNIFVAIILPIIVTAVLLVLFFTVSDIPLWVLLFLIIPVLMFVAGQKTKLVIEDGMLRYQMVFSGEEVALNKVAQIITREVETFVEKTGSDTSHNNNRSGLNINVGGQGQGNTERKVEKVVYVLDESGRTFFSFPANIIGLKDRRRFEEAVTAVNPNIEVI